MPGAGVPRAALQVGRRRDDEFGSVVTRRGPAQVCPYLARDDRDVRDDAVTAFRQRAGFPSRFAEPTNTMRPKITSKGIEFKDVDTGRDVALLCPGQAFPVPFYR